MKFYTRRRVSPVITIVSLVDILTMVLMFFVYTTTFKTQQPMVEIHLPEVNGVKVDASSSKPAILAITSKDELSLDGKVITLEELVPAVEKIRNEGRTLQLKGDEGAHFGNILKVFGSLKDAKISDLPTMTQNPK